MKYKFELAAIYDTETCNVGHDVFTRAYPVLFIDNDIRGVNIKEYTPDRDDKVNYYRHEQEMQDRIDVYVKYGIIKKVVPIICAYNLMFDLQPIIYDLSRRYDIKANAQSSTNAYVVDLYEPDTDNMVLRFWDTFHLEMRGLKAMGKTCGLDKAMGDWDYSLIRTPETPLTEQELYYAKRDVQVIPAYLSYLLKANEWMKQEDLGVRVLTKTSIVRQMARREIATIKIEKADGKKISLDLAFVNLCKKELPKNYDIYGLRKACFRGGFTFTAAKYANVVVHDTVSLDVVSMHHTFINGRLIPDEFFVIPNDRLKRVCDYIINRTLEDVLKEYHAPFGDCIHAKIRFNNVRLRKGTVFEKMGIALEPNSKFKKAVARGSQEGDVNEANDLAEQTVRDMGWHDTFEGATFALGKLYKADSIIVHFNEVELWCFSRVYEWDSFEVLFGEVSISKIKPPDFVTLQSNKLFEMKSACKFILKHYREGEPYPFRIPETIPDGLRDSLLNGTCETTFLESYYTSTVKGMFNGIYGTMAQDIYKPEFVCNEGDLEVNKNDVITNDNFDEKQPNTCRVLYTYGMRIVAGSRMHLIIAMELLYNSFGDKIAITGGDTDSVKVACFNNIGNADLLQSLEPLAIASKNAIDAAQVRVRKMYPKLASPLTGIGSFEIENENNHYTYHMDAWNKARLSYDGRTHITCAGLQRPSGEYHIETFCDELINKGYPIEDVFKNVLSYNVFVYNNVCHALEGYKAKANEIFDDEVTDYLGNKTHVKTHMSYSLYPSGRWLGETLKPTNRLTLAYLKSEYNRNVDDDTKYITRNDNGKAIMYADRANGTQVIMEA